MKYESGVVERTSMNGLFEVFLKNILAVEEIYMNETKPKGY